MIIMTRRLTFSAAHADWIEGLPEETNKEIFGLIASSEPYGHNYLLDVSVKGKINPKTGILINIKVLDQIVKTHVVQLLDRKFINRSVPRFEDRAVTQENLIAFIADQLNDRLPQEVSLCGLRLESTPSDYAEWRDPECDANILPDTRKPGEMLLTRGYEFAASHRLNSPHLSADENRELFGKCNYENGHGHNYEIEVTVAGPVEARSGRVLAPDVLDSIVHREVVDRYDHRHFNHDAPEFAGLIPSAEEITRVIWQRVEPHIPAPARLYRVLVRETARNFFEYFGEIPGKDNDVP